MSLIAVTIDAGFVVRACERVLHYAVDKSREDAAEIVIPDLVEGAQAGHSPSGESYAPYSDRWKKERERHGKQTGHVDLTFDGVMLPGLTFDEKDNSVGTVSDRTGALHGHQFGNPAKNLPKREVLGLSEAAKNKIEDVLGKKAVEAALG